MAESRHAAQRRRAGSAKGAPRSCAAVSRGRPPDRFRPPHADAESHRGCRGRLRGGGLPDGQSPNGSHQPGAGGYLHAGGPARLAHQPPGNAGVLREIGRRGPRASRAEGLLRPRGLLRDHQQADPGLPGWRLAGRGGHAHGRRHRCRGGRTFLPPHPRRKGRGRHRVHQPLRAGFSALSGRG